MATKIYQSAYHKFSEETHFHGFKELYYSNFICKIFWLSFIIGSISITVYQLKELAQEALDKKSTTVLEILEDEPEYPPIKVCYIEWYYWVDCNLTKELGLDKPTLMYALLHFADIFSDLHFNLTMEKINLKIFMTKNNFTTVLELYKAISPPNPPGFVTPFNGTYKWQKYIDAPMGAFCYVYNSDAVKYAIDTQNSLYLLNSKNNFLRLVYNQGSYIGQNCNGSSLEYTNSIKNLMENINFDINGLTVNLSNVIAGPYVELDGLDGQQIFLMKGLFSINVKISANLYKWLPNGKDGCIGKSIKPKNDYYFGCDKICIWQESINMYQKENRCFDTGLASQFGLDSMDRVCTQKITFLNQKIVVVGSANSRVIWPNNISDIISMCKSVECDKSCTVWKYTSAVNVVPVLSDVVQLNVPILLYISYPDKSEIIVSKEIYMQSWETLVGNIGGIIGLWLGASMMSIPQLLYLCTSGMCKRKTKVKVLKCKLPQN